jgi:glycosyltransferase involved in cell wall biosynthesis
MSTLALEYGRPWKDAAEPSGPTKILVLRCCRAAQFVDAVRSVRERYPRGVVTALTHRGHHDTLTAAGVDGVIEIPGRQFGLVRIAPWRLAALRLRRFDVVVIPQMTNDPERHANLYRLVAALASRHVVVIPGSNEPVIFDAAGFRRCAMWSSCTPGWDAVALLGMLLTACARRRRSEHPPAGKRRRVLHIISSLGIGGAQVQLMQLLARTPPEQYDVALLVIGASDGEFSRRWLTRADVDVSYVNAWPRLPHAVREVMIRCQSGGYDIVHTWLFFANVIGAAGARLAGVPLVICSVRNASVWKRAGWYRRWWWRAADVLASRAADVVTVNARALVADHASWACMPSRNIEVVHNGLDPASLAFDRAEGRAMLLQATGAPESAVFVGTVGRLAHEKDQATFLKVLARVRRVRRDVHAIIIGSGELRAPLERLAEQAGLAGAITFLGERSDARRLIAGFDLFLLTSRSEGFPNVLLEATFLGVPCVATSIAGTPDVLGRAASLFPFGDVAVGAERVLAALADRPAVLRQTAEVRRRALELFTTERSVAAWLGLYQRHVGARIARAASPLRAALQLPEAR